VTNLHHKLAWLDVSEYQKMCLQEDPADLSYCHYFKLIMHQEGLKEISCFSEECKKLMIIDANYVI
jgi:hypothetical protein